MPQFLIVYNNEECNLSVSTTIRTKKNLKIENAEILSGLFNNDATFQPSFTTSGQI